MLYIFSLPCILNSNFCAHYGICKVLCLHQMQEGKTVAQNRFTPSYHLGDMDNDAPSLIFPAIVSNICNHLHCTIKYTIVAQKLDSQCKFHTFLKVFPPQITCLYCFFLRCSLNIILVHVVAFDTDKNDAKYVQFVCEKQILRCAHFGMLSHLMGPFIFFTLLLIDFSDPVTKATFELFKTVSAQPRHLLFYARLCIKKHAR